LFYLEKPVNTEVLVKKVNHFMKPMEDIDYGLVAQDQKTIELVGLAKRVASSQATVMITGESGSGKEVFARFIHHHSSRAEGPFVAINCAALPENMLEAILFGYEKGAFTGAYESKYGKFELANNGSLLLDEISEMNMGLQAKLLRVLQEKEVERLGGRKIIPLNVRVLATSNRDLSKYVKEGKFREDLYYRLNVFPLHIPALRERPDDILPLAHNFVARHTAKDDLTSIEPKAKRRLMTYPWPGNVRELDNVIQRALILKTGELIQSKHICFYVGGESNSHNFSTVEQVDKRSVPAKGLGDNLKNTEQELILKALHSSNGSRKDVAALLGISPRTLRYKLARLREAGVVIPG
jgi:two-component system, response regulator FlrC